MISKKDIEQIVDNKLAQTPYFLVDVTVSNTNRIVVEIDSFDDVSLDFCVELSREVEQHFNRDIEDFELEIGSAGLSSPFKVAKQYEKNIGNEVELLTKSGEKLIGILCSASADSFCVEIEKNEKVEGSKRKIKVKHELNFKKENIKYIKHLIRFK